MTLFGLIFNLSSLVALTLVAVFADTETLQTVVPFLAGSSAVGGAIAAVGKPLNGPKE